MIHLCDVQKQAKLIYDSKKSEQGLHLGGSMDWRGHEGAFWKDVVVYILNWMVFTQVNINKNSLR